MVLLEAPVPPKPLRCELPGGIANAEWVTSENDDPGSEPDAESESLSSNTLKLTQVRLLQCNPGYHIMDMSTSGDQLAFSHNCTVSGAIRVDIVSIS